MPRLTLIAAATLLALPGAAWAQDVPAQDRPGRVAEVDAGAGAAAAMAERMEDPAFQQQLATAAAVMSEAMLDLPIGPMARAAAQAAGKDARDIDPDMTLRRAAGRDAERLPEEIAQRTPQMMGAMAGMARGMEAMMPALRDMAEKMREAMERARPAE
ncbi:hypothetical protein [Qipengyuania sp. YIM B01966]|uniref:hypothetical protein n=1 Tax=Qipengyuania sp. YIM B01966 TaxID=2778646 RepID=UPI0018F44996|nr:hypothetical protein [Qipengyuania sp. YIM B01966]